MKRQNTKTPKKFFFKFKNVYKKVKIIKVENKYDTILIFENKPTIDIDSSYTFMSHESRFLQDNSRVLRCFPKFRVWFQSRKRK